MRLCQGVDVLRNYDSEIKDNAERKYNYNFDYDVMHPFILRAFSPFFKGGAVLELGCFEGAFTQKLLGHFSDITCIEASLEALNIARERLKGNANLIHSLFEDAVLPKRYENIILTHVLEHIEKPLELLEKIRNEWLSDEGYLFIACPNANAASRQIAAKMQILSHNSVVTDGEFAHGHRITYSFDTLERDIRTVGLNIVYRSGIFFKALANFQWDRLLETDIISREYLEGCFFLGQQYPELCASIFFLCEK